MSGLSAMEMSRVRRAPLATSSEPENLRELPWELLDERALTERVKDLYCRLIYGGLAPEELALIMLRRGALEAQNNLRRPEDDGDEGVLSVTQNYAGSPTTVTHAIREEDFSQLARDDKTRSRREQEAIQEEQQRKLKSLPSGFWKIMATCAVGAIVQGWVQEYIVGANLYWPLELGLATCNSSDSNAANQFLNGQIDSCDMIFNDQTSIAMFSTANAVPYFAASILGPFVSDPIADICGRRVALVMAALASMIGAAIAAQANSWGAILAGRVLQGIGIGAKAAVIPVIESEISPYAIRGTLLISWQIFVATGIFLGAAANLVLQHSWRAQIGISALPAAVLFFMCFMIPETPHWRSKNHDFANAFRAFVKIRKTQLQACRDLYILYEYHRKELPPADEQPPSFPYRSVRAVYKVEKRRARFFGKFPTLFMQPRSRNALFAACVVMATQQMSGINLFAFLSTTIFQSYTASATINLDLALTFGAVNMAFSLLACFVIEKMGRRKLLLVSLLLMMPFLGGCGAVIDSPQPPPKAVLLALYTAAYSLGAGVIPFMYSSEVFPSQHRETGMAMACSVNFGLAGLLNFLVAYLRTPCSGGACAASNSESSIALVPPEILYIFVGLEGLAFVMNWFVMRSPRYARSLEKMDSLFQGPFFAYAHFQIWRLRRFKFVFRRKDPNSIGRRDRADLDREETGPDPKVAEYWEWYQASCRQSQPRDNSRSSH